MDTIAQDYDGQVSLCSDLGFHCEGSFDGSHNLWSRALVWDVLMACYMIWDRSPSLAHALVKFSSMRFGGTCEIVIGHFTIMRVENQENGILISFLLKEWCFWLQFSWYLSPVLPLPCVSLQIRPLATEFLPFVMGALWAPYCGFSVSLGAARCNSSHLYRPSQPPAVGGWGPCGMG